MTVSRTDVLHVAQLARLGLSAERADGLVHELNGILAHMDVLLQVDTSTIAVDASMQQSLRMRADLPNPVPMTGDRDAFAPSMRDGFFLVPRLATHGAAQSDDGSLDG